jgi:hypothetical protein
MKALINLIWNGDKLAKTIPLEVGDKGAELLLKNSQGSQFPAYIVPEDAGKYNLDVKIEDVSKTKAHTKKAAPTAAKENTNARPKILSKEEIEAAAKENAGDEAE